MMMNNFEMFTSPAILQAMANHRRRLRNSTLALLILISISCNDKEEANLVDRESNNGSVANVDLVKVDLMEDSSFKKIINALELKKTPIID